MAHLAGRGQSRLGEQAHPRSLRVGFVGGWQVVQGDECKEGEGLGQGWCGTNHCPGIASTVLQHTAVTAPPAHHLGCRSTRSPLSTALARWG